MGDQQEGSRQISVLKQGSTSDEGDGRSRRVLPWPEEEEMVVERQLIVQVRLLSCCSPTRSFLFLLSGISLSSLLLECDAGLCSVEGPENLRCW